MSEKIKAQNHEMSCLNHIANKVQSLHSNLGLKHYAVPLLLLKGDNSKFQLENTVFLSTHPHHIYILYFYHLSPVKVQF